MSDIYDPGDCVTEDGVECSSCIPLHCYDHHDECRLTIEGKCVEREDRDDLMPGSDDPLRRRRSNQYKKEGFKNIFTELEFNETCMVLTVLYITLFLYKKEVMGMVNNIFK
tara:strand:+ start:859 stop:1191 length:333 start_codon:yes stop_codon:yes gene_type:complete